MKTTADLMDALVVMILEHSTHPPEVVRMKLEEFRRTFRQNPPTALTDAAFESQLAKIRQELPAYLRDLGL